MLTGVDWLCVDESCRGVLGRIVKGELVLKGQEANTDGVNLVVTCPKCGKYKIWYAKDKAVIVQFFNVFAQKVSLFVGGGR